MKLQTDAMDSQSQAEPQPQKSCKMTPTPTPPPPTSASTKKAHSHVCSYCQASFRRDEHLQRHIRTHTGEKKYRCPCKMTFARNDVFVRHMRICRSGSSVELRCAETKSQCRTKTKRACDECAKAKAKCNYQVPCDRCHRKSIKCEKTRKGYEDPYAIYSIATPATTPPVTTEIEPEKMTNIELLTVVNGEQPVNGIINHAAELGSVGTIPPVDPALQRVDEMCIAENEPSLSQDLSENEQNNMALMLPPSPQMTQIPDNSEVFMEHYDMMTEYDLVSSHCDLSLDPDPMSLHLTAIENLDLLLNPNSHYQAPQGYDFFPFHQMETPFISNGFSMNRLDPLQAKCNDIIELLKQVDPHGTDQNIYAYITRQNLVHLCHLYGKHFQQNLSIIHSPTFDMTKSPPYLLLAIMLVGACYAPDTIPASQVAKLARRLLTAIALEPYETEMSCPSIALVQAGVLICCVLSCSKDTEALRSVRLCTARNISMCERAGLLDPVEPVNYNLLTEETFDWHLWIQRESGKRVASEIFCQDMVHCIFLGRTPDFDPRQFHVELPSYECCWEAETAAECLHALQTMPQPIRGSVAIDMLLSWPDSDTALFEASGFGMFVLINGMHYLLHQATQADKQTSRYLSEIPESDSTQAIERLREDPTGPSITAIADRALKMHASPIIRRVDNALNAWRTTWDLRRHRDNKHEPCTFKGDPLPFWWLAKLYLLLHYHGHILQPDNEYASPRAEAPDNYGKTLIQRKVVGWLSSFRGRKFKVDVETENWLPDLMKITHENAP